jgi:hypothetical protein
MSKHEFYIAGRWRNKEMITEVVTTIRASRRTAYCFIENEYKGEKIEFKLAGNPDVFMKQSEVLAQDDPLIRKIFEADIAAERDADIFMLVFPAGFASHIEAGVAFGMGKKCYAVGVPEKTETLYCVFEKIFPDIDALKKWLTV